MKNTASILFITFLFTQVSGQVNIIPYVGMNTTRMNDKNSFVKGGSFPLSGLDIEWRKKTVKKSTFHFSVATGMSYLENGFYNSSSFAYTALDYYNQEITDLKMQYVQVPLVFRLNWQPFPLVEDWNIFWGAGVFSNFLLHSSLREEYTLVIYNIDINAPPTTVHYEDARDITELGKSQSFFRRIELGMNYKKWMVGFRLSKSLTDLYHTGLEKIWRVPEDKSGYISAHETDGKTTEKYTELIIGFRIGRK